MVAFALDLEQVILLKGSRLTQIKPFWLPLLLTWDIGSMAEATKFPLPESYGCL